jgi:heavy metal translocating P-type ATPase
MSPPESELKVQLTGDVVVTIPEAHKFAATLSISGMTCAACILSIKEGVEGLKFLEDINVSLLTHSASVAFAGPKENVDQLVERIEDRGFDCVVESIAEIGGLHTNDQHAERTVMTRIEGMYCPRCPQWILDGLLSAFPGLVTVNKAPSCDDPIMTVTYLPQPGIVTIRDILATIHGVNERLKADIYQPPTIEQRAQAMQVRERRRLLYRLLLSFIVAIPTFLIGVVWMSLVPSTNSVRIFFQQKMWSGISIRSEWALFFLATPVMFFAADVFHVRAMKEMHALWGRKSKVPILRRFYRFGSMNLLMSAGTSAAYFPSIGILALNARGPRAGGKSDENTSTYFDSVVFLTLFILSGRYLEAYSKAKAGDAVMMLGKLRPSEALLVSSVPDSPDAKDSLQKDLRTEMLAKVHVDLLEAGDVVRVPRGASPPADGTVLHGTTTFDESSLTGESFPIEKRPGDQVFTGTVNTGNPITMQVTSISGTAMLDQIVRAVREGQTKRAPVERLADILTGYFVPVITLLAVSTFAIWLGLGLGGILPENWLESDTGGWAFWALQFSIAVFVGACPCGIALAAPTALFVGSGLAAKHGILAKGGGEAFQEASALDVVVFDKTGTLTIGGSPEITHHEIKAASPEEARTICAIAKALEDSSSHPIAQSIALFCGTQDRASIIDSVIEELSGCGLKGVFAIQTSSGLAKYEAAIGNEAFITSLGTPMDETSSETLVIWKSAGNSIALLALRSINASGDTIEDPTGSFRLVAQFAAADSPRPEASYVVSVLQRQGLSTWMISGDNATTAAAIGSRLGIPAGNIIAGVLPSEKADKIRWLQSHCSRRSGRGGRPIVAMVGDGINDSPALTAADVGIAIGSGSDIAISSAKFVLVSSNLHSLLTLIELSRTVFRRVKFNFAWALVYNMVLLPIAAGAIYPVHGHPVLNPVWASLAMALSSLSVVCSSLVMRTRIPGVGFRGSGQAAQ